MPRPIDKGYHRKLPGLSQRKIFAQYAYKELNKGKALPGLPACMYSIVNVFINGQRKRQLAQSANLQSILFEHNSKINCIY